MVLSKDRDKECKEYILYYYNGAVRRVKGIFSELQKQPICKIKEVDHGRISGSTGSFNRSLCNSSTSNY